MKIKKRNTASVVGRANAMCVGIDDHPTLFTSPAVPTSAIQAQVVIVNKCEVVAATHAKGAASARDVQRNLLVGMMETELTYIQNEADKSPTWDQAVATIKAGGLLVATAPTHVKGILEVKKGPTADSVALVANTAVLTAGLKGRFFFNWQSTIDGKNFVTLPPTPKGKTTVSSLTLLTSYGFRVSVTNAAGIAGEWSQTVYFLVH
jgi:hypothetical protein